MGSHSVTFCLFFFIGLSRYWGHLSSINDLGVFDQVVWNTLHGNFFQTTINPFYISINWLGFHFQPILLLFVPLYALIPNVAWLTIAQAAALALTAWPLFLIARHIFHSDKAGFYWALIYLMNPFLLSAGAWDFHPITLAVPFIALGSLAVVKKDIRVLVISCLVILTCKEHLGLAVVGFGVLWWLRHHGWKKSMLVITLGIGHLLLVLCFLMPALSPIDAPIMFGKQLGQLSRYSWLGTSFTEVFHTLATQPYFVLKVVTNWGGLTYLLGLVTPFIFVFPFVGFPFLLPGLGDLIANTLSANSMPRGIWSYHSVALIPLITAAAIIGVKRASHWQNKFSSLEFSGLILTSSLVLGYFLLPLPLPYALNYWSPVNVLNLTDPGVQIVRNVVGSKSSLSVQANVGAHFTQRQSIYIFPNKIDDVDAIVLHLASPTNNINDFPELFDKTSRKGNPTWLDGYLQMDRSEYLATIEFLLKNRGYGILLWNTPWLVLSKKEEDDLPEDMQKVKNWLKKLHGEWQIEASEYQDALEKVGS